MQLPAIVIPAYNRPQSLMRLLQSVSKAVYTEQAIPLIISIDKSDNAEVTSIAEEFVWVHGTKTVIKREKHLGLKEHILCCGDLTETYDSAIILEDDLYVSPQFYNYTLQALGFYSKEENGRAAAGVSLFNYEVTENGFAPFEPIPDGSDVYFMQMASSWGQCWTAEQWRGFRNWFSGHQQILSTEKLPEYILNWSDQSWKKHFVRYLIATDKYFVFPRVSLSTNFGEPGTNTDRRGLFQSLLLTEAKIFSFKPFAQSLAVYDSWFEIEKDCFRKIAPAFAEYNVEIDLYGTKKLSAVKSSFLISSKTCLKPLQSFGNELRPLLLNITMQNNGSVFHLGAVDDFKETDIDKQIFYPAVSSISDIVFYEKIKALSEERIQKQLEESRYYDKHKELAIVIFDTEKQSYGDTLKSIQRQNYPHLQLIVVTDKSAAIPLDEFGDFKKKWLIQASTEKELVEQLLATQSSLFVLVRAGDMFAPETFQKANTVFRKFDFIHLLQGLSEINGQTEKPELKRTNRNIFLRNSTRHQHFVASSFFFDRYALQRVSENGASTDFFQAPDLAYHLVCHESVYVTPTLFSTTALPHQPALNSNGQVSWNMLQSVAQYFFENNTTYLRYFFQQWQQLPPVVRFEEKTQSWYLSNY